MKSILRFLIGLGGSLLVSGCATMSSLHTSSQHSAKAVWPDFNGAKAAFDRIVPGQTTLAELRELGFDPYQNANVRVLNYLDIQNRFLPTPSIRMEDLPAPVRQSLDAKEQSLAYELDLTVLNAQRYGNLALDMLAFNRKTHETGWSFKALILLNHDKVLYKLWSGQPHLDRVEQKKQPLGPFQDLEGVARFSVLH